MMLLRKAIKKSLFSQHSCWHCAHSSGELASMSRTVQRCERGRENESQRAIPCRAKDGWVTLVHMESNVRRVMAKEEWLKTMEASRQHLPDPMEPNKQTREQKPGIHQASRQAWPA